MSFSLLFSITKHLWPANWFAAIAKEAEQIPAVVAAGLVLWATVIVGISLGYYEMAEAEERDYKMANLIAANQKELSCARRDRSIAAKNREIANLRLLIERTEDESEVRRMAGELDSLVKAQEVRERLYMTDCINGS